MPNSPRHRDGENDRFISRQLVQQRVISLDESFLFRRVQLAGDRFRFAMFQAETMERRDETRPALIIDADPGAHLPGRAGQGFGDPRFQAGLSLHRRPANAAFMPKAGQTLDPVSLIQLVQGPDRVLVRQHFAGGGAGHSAQAKKRPGTGRSEADHRKWTNAFFAGQGLFTLQAAHASARQAQ